MFAVLPHDGALLVAGDLTRATVGQFDDALAGAAPPIVLDLGELRRLDEAGVACLRRWIGRGVTVRRMSRLIYLLLQTDPSVPPVPAAPDRTPRSEMP